MALTNQLHPIKRELSKESVGLFAKIPELAGRPASTIPYIAQLDGLRAVAILLVLFWHSSLRAARYADNLRSSGQSIRSLYWFVPHGEIGVALFFFLSGLVIAKPFLAKRNLGILQFYGRRLRRIYPPYAIAVFASFFILGVLHENPGRANAFRESQIPLGQSLAASLVYMHSIIWGTASRLLPPAWSLEIEMQFYLLAPLFLNWYAREMKTARRKKLAVLICLLLTAVNLFEVFYTFDNRFRFGFAKHLYLFLAGILAADLTPSAQKESPNGDALFAVGITLLVTIGYCLTQVDARPSGGLLSLLSDTGQLIAVCLIYYGAMYGKVARTVLSWKWLCLAGTMCYSIYLIHLPLMQAFSQKVLSRLKLTNSFLIWPLWMLILTVGSIIAAFFFYVLFERPFMSSKRKIRQHLSKWDERNITVAANEVR